MSDARRIVQVLGSSAGGVARHVAQISAELARDPDGGVGDGRVSSGRTVRVAGPSALRDQVAPAGSNVGFMPVEITDRPGAGDLTSIRALRRLLRESDVMHAHGLRAGALVVLAGAGLRRSGRARTVVTLHNLPVGSRAVRAVSAVLERVVVRADVVLGVSLDLVDLARRRGSSSAQRALVPAPPRPLVDQDARRVRHALGLDDERLVVTVGRLAPQKGLDTLCDAAAQVARADLPGGVRWVVAGDGPLRGWLEREIEARSLPIIVLGFRDDAPELMAAADVVASTAVWEGQPIWLQEALAVGASIVATDAGGTREVTGDAAVLVPVSDASGLAVAIVELLLDESRRAALSGAARIRSAALPTILDVVSSLTQAYQAERSEG